MNRTLSVAGCGILVVLSIIQLALGASLLSVVLAVSSVLVAFIPVLLYGLVHPVGLTFLMVGTFAGVTPLILKTVILSPIDDGLFVPELSWTVVFLGVLAAVVGAIIAYPIARNFKGLTRLNPTNLELRVLALVSLGLFLAIDLLSGLGAFFHSVAAQIGSVLVFGLICETVRTIRVSNYARAVSPLNTLILIVAIITTTGGNSKMGFAMSGLALLMTCLACGYRMRTSHLILGVAVVSYLTLVVFPVIHTVRAYRASISFVEMLEITTKTTIKYTIGEPSTVRLVNESTKDQDARFMGSYQITYVANNNFIDRVTIIAISDAILRAFGSNDDYVGYEFYKKELVNLLPFVGGARGQARSAGDFILGEKGLSRRDIASRVSLPFPAEAFAMDGYRGILLVITPTFFLLALTFSFFYAPVTASIWTIHFFVTKIFMLPASHAGGVFGDATRGILNDMFLFVVIMGALFGWRMLTAGGHRTVPAAAPPGSALTSTR